MCRMKKWVIVLGIVLVHGTGLSLPVVNPNYIVEEYCSYTYTSTLGEPRGMTFDDSGNLYVSHRGDANIGYQNANIMKISSDTTVTPLVTDLTNSRRISWAGGTSYGNYLYVEELYAGNIYQVDTNGNKNLWAQIPNNGILSHGIDRTGNYGSVMYASSESPRNMYTISTTGQVDYYNDFPPEIGTGIFDLIFDTKGTYGGYMYANVFAPGEYSNGLYQIDTDGSATLFPTPLLGIECINFDQTSQAYFDGMLYALGYTATQGGIWSVDDTGNISLLAYIENATSSHRLWYLTFGPDGNMYAAEHNAAENTTTINRIMPIPEPMGLLLLMLGGSTLVRRRNKR